MERRRASAQSLIRHVKPDYSNTTVLCQRTVPSGDRMNRVARSLRKQIRNDEQVSRHMLRLGLMSLDGSLFFMTSPPLDIHPLQCLLCGEKRSSPATSMKAAGERDLFPNRVKIS
jgi:hypothetical protein